MPAMPKSQVFVPAHLLFVFVSVFAGRWDFHNLLCDLQGVPGHLPKVMKIKVSAPGPFHTLSIRPPSKKALKGSSLRRPKHLLSSSIILSL